MPNHSGATISPSLVLVDNFDRYTAAWTALSKSVYHHPGWRAVLATYGLRTHWLVAERDDQPVGLLPLVRQSSRLFGKRLISLPWVDEAGAIGTDEAVDALLAHAILLADESSGSIPVTLKQPIAEASVREFPDWSLAEGDKLLLWRKLSMPSEELWDEFSPKVRNQVRKAEKNGIVTIRGGADLIEEFYQVYSQNMRDLGSPSHSLKFFRTLVSVLGDRASIYCTQLEGNSVGAGLVLDNRPSLDIPWASSLLAYNRLCVNHAMYWQILADACEAGYERFHFGRSSIGSGQHKFKKQWGAEESPLNWLAHPQPSNTAESDDPMAVREKFGLAQRMWTKLPIWAARALGPQIIRNVP